MNRKVLVMAVALMAVAMLATPLLGTVEACGFGRRWRRAIFCGMEMTVTDMDGYTEYVGTLGGANFVLRIPNEDWNGMLVLGCHAYISSHMWNNPQADPPIPQIAQFAMDNLAGIGFPFALVEQGFAYAASTYGEGGFAVKKGMSTTVQLTLFSLLMLRCQFRCWRDIKVFIIGQSMGGAIGLLLGAKYPQLYDGVLDISGMRDIVLGYTDSVELIEGYDADPMNVPPAYWPLIPNLRVMVADMEAEFGGSYDDNPKAYEKLNPVDNAKIRIPMISVTGALDPLSVNQVNTFKDAVDAAGRSKYYRLYVVPGGLHANALTINEALSHFAELVNYPDGW